VKWCGATPIATAGSAEKRPLLHARRRPQRIRGHGFVDEVMKIKTRGRDVVLNSLAGKPWNA
jgi:hypothetical protein